MPIHLLTDALIFPDPEEADDETGILAVGGDLSVPRLLLAYRQGIFPWYDEAHSPILWHSPAWRMVLTPDKLHVGRTLRKIMRRGELEIRYDTAFEQVIRACAETPRPGQRGTWLNPRMQRAYVELHRRGLAHSAEAWQDGRLVGGLYGVTLGGAFFGESMFSRVSNASKITFVTTVQAIAQLGYRLIDCQVYTEHLETFGAEEWPRRRFLQALQVAIRLPPARPWPRSGR